MENEGNTQPKTMSSKKVRVIFTVLFVIWAAVNLGWGGYNEYSKAKLNQNMEERLKKTEQRIVVLQEVNGILEPAFKRYKVEVTVAAQKLDKANADIAAECKYGATTRCRKFEAMALDALEKICQAELDLGAAQEKARKVLVAKLPSDFKDKK